jgi:hypothetical protein
MLIGLTRRFIFIANMKTASTAIEQALRPVSEIVISEAPFDRHVSFATIEHRFRWIFEQIPRDQFTIFGIMRDPIDFLVSLYNSHTHRSFRIVYPHLYTGNLSFDQFLAKWCEQNADQLASQHSRFIDNNGAIAANYIVSYGRLKKGLRHIASRIDAPELLNLPMVNVSNHRIHRHHLTMRQRGWISERFAVDQQFIQTFCDRPLNAADSKEWRLRLRPDRLQAAE